VPWTALFPAAFSGLRQRGMKDPFLRFALCWLLFPFLFFSASRGKLGTYILPCFPALAILVSQGLESALEAGRSRAFDLGALVLAVGLGILAIALPLSWLAGFPGFGFYGPSETWKWLIAALGLLIWGGITAIAAKAKGPARKLVLYCAAPVFFMFSGLFLVPDMTLERKAPGEFLSRHLERITPDTIVVSSDDPVRAVCWFFKCSDVYLIVDPGELSYGLQYPGSRHRLLTVDQLRRLIEENSGKKRVILIARSDAYEEYRREIPKPLFEDHDIRFVFAQF
jgi:4-amino-4-deoxy-L-arabinose transferase